MPNSKISFKNDKYKKARGGYSRLLDVSCTKCGTHLCYYQKDGPGILKRMYLDRIYGLTLTKKNDKSLKQISDFTCPLCKRQIGVTMIHKKENRLAYRLFVGAVIKKIIKLH